MKVFTNNSFVGYYPIGSAAVVVASSKEEAATMLEQRLAELGLGQSIDPKDMLQMSYVNKQVVILRDGSY